MSLSDPLVYNFPFKNQSIDKLESSITDEYQENSKYLLDFPTVYVINDSKASKYQQRYTVYVGETSNIRYRTAQHISREDEEWSKLIDSGSSNLYVIGHDYFNKSLTLDVENKLMLYLSSLPNVEKVLNRKTNEQNIYYTEEHLESLFKKIWEKLREKDSKLFLDMAEIHDSAIFKASPFHKLTDEQRKSKDNIELKIREVLASDSDEHELVVVSGEAGSGKTILLTSLFYSLYKDGRLSDDEEVDFMDEGLNVHLLVNHNQQFTVYSDIANRLDMKDPNGKLPVAKPTPFIRNNEPGEDIDVLLIDEAHTLLTRGKYSYQGSNHLDDLLKRAKVVVAVFDRNQIVATESFVEDEDYEEMIGTAEERGNLIELHNQMRIKSNKNTVQWIRNITDEYRIDNIPHDNEYDIKIFDSPVSLHKAIKKKAENQDRGISRLVATFDWEYSGASRPTDKENWDVSIGDWSLPWNLQLDIDPKQKFMKKRLSWAEQNQTINEVGSTFTVQGFDLNYVGLIIGPSVKYRDGNVIFDPSESKNKNATQNRTLKSGKKQKFGEFLLKNELNVLLTRGVYGLYIYAVDEELQEQLEKAARGEL